METSAEITTERLLLRQFRAEDLAAHRAAVDDDPAVTWTHTRVPLADSLRRWAGRLDAWSRDGFGMWIAAERSSGAVLGHCGLQRLEGGDDVELAYYLGRPAWGHGYATEAALAVLRFAFEQHGLARVVAVVRHENAASRRVLEKIGMRHERDGHWYGCDAALYGIERDAFPTGGAAAHDR
ncbi:GNAT family N-acetyltransferase [Actinoplanes sp. URMC 104]|uniref:GNAT family N-acetyltransferase n=1 Tax=Actinoplanes sp. URMC 104 TaxID=3423409 RepID=UPI003F1CBF2F